MKNPRIVLMGGSGGVGKTTLSAALACQLASQGHKTLVLTVDPARRLAQALGLTTLDSSAQRVQAASGQLFASMLHPQHTLDNLVTKMVSDPEQRSRILNHPIYRAMVEQLGGTHEYAAMEKLLEYSEGPYDRIVVDTPPSQNAVDLLTAPERLIQFMDGSVFRWFTQATGPWRLLQAGASLGLKALEKILGRDFFETLTSFFRDIESLRGGFRERHERVIALLQSKETAFHLVSYASQLRFKESEQFAATLAERRIPLHQVILNKLEPAVPSLASTERASHPALAHGADYLNALHQVEQTWIHCFTEHFATTPIRTIFKQEIDAAMPLESLSKLGALLVK